MSYTSGGGDNLDARERLGAMERGDSFAPATAEILCYGFAFVPSGLDYIFPVTFVRNLRGRIFEHNFPAQAIKIKQGGVFGYTLSVNGAATGPSTFGIQMIQQVPPYHIWQVGRMPFNAQEYYLAYDFGGVQYVNVPEGGAEYQVRFYNLGGPGGFAVNSIIINLVYLGTR